MKVWEIQKSGPQSLSQGSPPVVQCNAVKGPEHAHDLPVLCSAISRDCRIFSGGCDKMVKCWELASGKAPYQVAQHDQPIKGVAYVEEVCLSVPVTISQSCRMLSLVDVTTCAPVSSASTGWAPGHRRMGQHGEILGPPVSKPSRSAEFARAFCGHGLLHLPNGYIHGRPRNNRLRSTKQEGN